jgi:cytoskeletal protein RodZ
MELGQYLKSVREQKGISLGAVADTTKITIRYLEAIENGRFELLPNRIFARGFVKSYAKCIGLNPDGAAASFDSISNAIAKTTNQPPGYRPVRKIVTPPKAEKGPAFKFQIPRLKLGKWAVFFIIAAIVIALAAIMSYS